jgi:hypothetical protein
MSMKCRNCRDIDNDNHNVVMHLDVMQVNYRALNCTDIYDDWRIFGNLKNTIIIVLVSDENELT